MDSLDNYVEVGGRCDMIYHCDCCGDCEYSYDDETGLEVVSYTRMFRHGTDDLCEYCLTLIIEAKNKKEREILKCKWQANGF